MHSAEKKPCCGPFSTPLADIPTRFVASVEIADKYIIVLEYARYLQQGLLPVLWELLGK
jgi:hypothetical protein